MEYKDLSVYIYIYILIFFSKYYWLSEIWSVDNELCIMFKVDFMVTQYRPSEGRQAEKLASVSIVLPPEDDF